MAVISLTIIASEEEIVQGIPRSISIEANIPSTIFYTLDGSDPTIMSDIYISPIITDSSKLSLTLKVFATNGSDSSPIIIETYFTSVMDKQRRSRAQVAQQTVSSDSYPFGNGSVDISTQYSGTSGIVVSTPGNTNYIDGYGSDGNPNSYSDEPFTTENYSIKYVEDYHSNPNSGIGTLPGPVRILIKESVPDSTEMYSNTFDPKAMVIYQDFSDQTLEDNPQINKMTFSLPNTDSDFDGNKLFSTGLEGGSAHTAHFIKSCFNPKFNTMTYYYRDSRTNKWIISTQPYNNNGEWSGSLINPILSNKPGSRFVHEWIRNFRRTLF